MQLEENKLYTYVEIVNYLNESGKTEERVYVNLPERKNLRALMYDDGDRYYSVNVTEHAYMFRGKPATKCIFSNGVIPMVKVDTGE